MAHVLSSISSFFSRVRKDEKGTQLVETAVWLGLITALAVATVITIGTDVQAVMEAVEAALPTPPAPAP